MGNTDDVTSAVDAATAAINEATRAASSPIAAVPGAPNEASARAAEVVRDAEEIRDAMVEQAQQALAVSESERTVAHARVEKICALLRSFDDDRVAEAKDRLAQAKDAGAEVVRAAEKLASTMLEQAARDRALNDAIEAANARYRGDEMQEAAE